MTRARTWIGTALAIVLAIGCGGSNDVDNGSGPTGAGGGATSSSSAGPGGSGSSSSGGGGGGGGPFAICPEQHVLADGVIVCDKAFDTAPFVHLPPAGGLNDFFALDCKDFIDRDGNHHASLQGGLCQSLDGQPNDDALGHAFAIYEVTLCGETNPDGPCGTTGSPGDVWAFARFAVIDEKNVLLPFTNRAAEGAISAKQADGTFELTPSLPIRVALGAPKVKTAKDDGTSIYAIDLSIDNLTSGATSAGGTCLPSLASAGAADPFGTSTNVSLALYRVPSMHAPGDDEGVIEFFVDGASRGTDMATSWFVGPAAMIATTAPPPPSAYDGFGHGTPGSVMNLDLDLVTGGGGACTP